MSLRKRAEEFKPLKRHRSRRVKPDMARVSRILSPCCGARIILKEEPKMRLCVACDKEVGAKD